MTDGERLRQRLQDDLKTAMRAGDVTAREAIRFLLSVYRNAEIEKRGDLSADEEWALVQRQVKQRTDSIEQFRAAGRDDLVDREEAQLEVIRRYLPAQMSDDDLTAIVRDAIASTGAGGPKDMGKVMPLVLGQVGGGADARRVSTVVRSLLAEN